MLDQTKTQAEATNTKETKSQNGLIPRRMSCDVERIGQGYCPLDQVSIDKEREARLKGGLVLVKKEKRKQRMRKQARGARYKGETRGTERLRGGLRDRPREKRERGLRGFFRRECFGLSIRKEVAEQISSPSAVH